MFVVTWQVLTCFDFNFILLCRADEISGTVLQKDGQIKKLQGGTVTLQVLICFDFNFTFFCRADEILRKEIESLEKDSKIQKLTGVCLCVCRA